MKAVCLVAASVLGSGCASAPLVNTETPSDYLLLLAADKDGAEEDFFAVVDVRPGSPTAGRVVSTTFYGHRHSMPHHMEYALPRVGQQLFANAHHAEVTMLVDFGDAPRLRVTRSITPPAPLRFPHDYARLANGNMLVGHLRSDGPSPQPGDTESPGGHGGIAEYTAGGELVRMASAAVPGHAKPIRTYALLPMLEIDRVVTTSARMMEQHSANVIQIWRYSDLTLLQTLDVPAGRQPDGSPLDWAAEMPFALRLMRDGSILLNSYMCGFYRLTDIDSAAPRLTHVYDIQGRGPEPLRTRVGCSVPVVVGRYWIMPVAWSQMIVVLDIADTSSPKEVARLTLPPDFDAHWAVKDPGSNRIALGAEVEKEKGIYMLVFDPATGALSLDESVSSTVERPGYIDLETQAWPHGASGAAWAHAALFLPSKDAQANADPSD